MNISDIITQGERAINLNRQSEWQNRPRFLNHKEDEWPLKASNSGIEFPDQIVMNVEIALTFTSQVATLIGIARFSNYHKLLCVTARIVFMTSKIPPSLENIAIVPARDMIKKAKDLCI